MPRSQTSPCSSGLSPSKYTELGPTEGPDVPENVAQVFPVYYAGSDIMILSYTQTMLCSLQGLFKRMNSFEFPETGGEDEGKAFLSLPSQK